MFLRRRHKIMDGERYEYWSLVETVRTSRGPRHRTIAQLGKLLPEEIVTAEGWDSLDDVLSGGAKSCPRQGSLFESREEKLYEGRALWKTIDVSRVRVERVREFGRSYVGLLLWRRLGLDKILKDLVPGGKESVGWDTTACVLTLGRFSAVLSELSIAEKWYSDTALEDLLGIPVESLNSNRLYRGLDHFLPHKDALSSHLIRKYEDWFGVNFEFLLYDVTSTYFEGTGKRNEQARRGYSRDSRPDCPQVCIGLVVSPEGLPLAYEVFDGNRADVTTLDDIVTLMESKYGKAKRVWVFDRGITSEDNLKNLRERGGKYIVGTPKSHLKRHEAALLEEENWELIRDGLEVKLVESPLGSERFILCRSTDRAEKERAMLEQQMTRLKAELERINQGLKKRPSINTEKIERRIGRWLGRYTAAEKLITVTLIKNADGAAVGLEIIEHTEKKDSVSRAFGAYLLRTNYSEGTAQDLWKWYIQLSQAEAAFRAAKSDLHLRPVFHQKKDRVNAHILVCFLSLALWRTLELWMKSKGLGTCARQFLQECERLQMMDVILPTDSGIELRLRVVATPDSHLQILLQRLGIKLPKTPKLITQMVKTCNL